MEKNNFVYLGDGVKKVDKYIEKLNAGKIIKKYYIVAIEDNKSNPEIIISYMFLQKYFRQKNYRLIAITKEENEALLYIKNLTQLSLQKYGEINYLKTINELCDHDMFIFNEIDEDE